MAQIKTAEYLKLVGRAQSAEERAAALESAATVALKWMDWWLNEDQCECDGIGHSCGWSDRKAEADTLRAALSGGKGE